jgi:predicted dehydrogenase
MNAAPTSPPNPPGPSSSPSVSASLGVSVVGLGTMGLRRLTALRRLGSARLDLVYDVDAGRCREAAARFGCRAAGSLAELVGSPGTELVFVCTPNAHHEDSVRSALEAGKHAFCEKPLALDAAGAGRIVESARAHRRTVRVGANLRQFPQVRKATELITTGAIGRLRIFRGWIGHDGSKLRSEWYRHPEVSGGGTMIDNGVHLLDLAHSWMGPATDADARTMEFASSRLEDYVTADFATREGGIVQVVSSWVERSGYFYLEVHGELGFLLVDGRSSATLTWGGSDADAPRVFDYSGEPRDSWDREVSDHVERIRLGGRGRPDAEDGRAVLEMVDAAYRSARLGRRVPIETGARRS